MIDHRTHYDRWHQGNVADDSITAPWHLFVEKHLEKGDLDQKKILEIGCGRGGFSNFLSRHRYAPARIFACDYSAAAIAIGQQKYPHLKITWQKEDIMSMYFDDNSFDTVISCETIEHVPHSKQAILELYRVLKPQGRMFLTCPNYFNLFGVWCLYRWIIGKPFTEGGQPYVNFLQMPWIYWRLRKTGFTVEKLISSEIIIPAKIPKHYYDQQTPPLLKVFGSRMFYILHK